MTDNITPGFRALLGRLKTYVVEWKFSFVPTENVEYEVGTDREEADLAKANVVSSERKDILELFTREPIRGYHVVAIDLDIPAYLIPSSTPGHSHLYIDVPGGIPWEKYSRLLDALADCGVIEQGYAEVSKKRGHSDLRLPWVSKHDQKLLTPDEVAAMAPQVAPLPVDPKTEFPF